MNSSRIVVSVNGSRSTHAVPVGRRLIDLLREDLRLTGTKEGCGVGACGLCSVIVDGRLVSACLTAAVQVDGCEVETVEGLTSADGRLSPLQEAFIGKGAFQCGICTPGQLMAATALLREQPHPTTAAIRQWMSGNLCRCTGYESVVEAITTAAGADPES